MEMGGIEPPTFCMRNRRTATVQHPHPFSAKMLNFVVINILQAKNTNSSDLGVMKAEFEYLFFLHRNYNGCIMMLQPQSLWSFACIFLFQNKEAATSHSSHHSFYAKRITFETQVSKSLPMKIVIFIKSGIKKLCYKIKNHYLSCFFRKIQQIMTTLKYTMGNNKEKRGRGAGERNDTMVRRS